ncbi:site-2 protease family protein [Candidatus Woesearchaeota archaeon]|nr:site-2 protease family protein [Candidatus Woesearchaeota archaeon]
MIYISYILVDGAFNLLSNPNAPPVITPVIPGIKIPGSPIFVPFWYGIIAIFIVAALHEFSHGVVARAYKIKVKNSGVVFFGPIIGAFVEPDETELRKSSFRAQLSVFSAGPFSNILTGIIILLLLGYIISPTIDKLIDFDGIKIDKVEDGKPADLAGLEEGYIVRSVNDLKLNSTKNFADVLFLNKPGDVIIFSDGKNEYDIVLGNHPNNESMPYLGIVHSQNLKVNPSIAENWGNYLPWFILYLREFLLWLFVLSVGIGLANLLPLGPVDGGRMFQLSLFKTLNQNKVRSVWKFVNSIVILLLLFNLFYPYLRYIF